MNVQALRWTGDALEVLDQRLLPDRIVFLTCRTAAEVAAAIRDMAVRGAPAIGCAAAFGIALEPGESSYKILSESRPTAVNLFWALARMRRAADKKAEAEAIFAEDLAVNRAIGAHGAKLIPQGARVLTYCNTGALATSGHGTALGVIRSARDKGVSVIACETRPYLQGARLTAWECMQEGIACTLITDNMAGHLMSRKEIDLVIVGADRIAANGDTANKIGTYALALAAKHHALPFYVVAPTSTLDGDAETGTDIPIEERDATEVSERFPARNPAFDVTPAALITAIVTEEGVHRAPYSASLPVSARSVR